MRHSDQSRPMTPLPIKRNAFFIATDTAHSESSQSHQSKHHERVDDGDKGNDSAPLFQVDTTKAERFHL